MTPTPQRPQDSAVDTADTQELRARIALLEDELRLTNERLRQMEELDRIHADFAFAISHELRTPLTLISGYAQKLLLRWGFTDDERRRGMVEKINVSSRRLSRLIDDMLLVTDVERGELPLHMRGVDIADVVAAALADLRDRHPAGLPSIETSGGPLRVRADGFRLEQVLICLLDNAAKHSPPGSTIAVCWRREDAHATVSVSDQGGGIDAADLPRLFARFGRVERVLGQSSGGVGLGLYIARRLVEAMDGRIEVESVRGEGSTFCVKLPSE